MAALTATPTIFETMPDTMYLTASLSSSATSMTINYVPLSMVGGILVLDEGFTNEERVSFGGVTDNGDGTATLTDCRRALKYGGGTLYAANQATAYEHTANSSTVRLVIAHEYLQNTAYLDNAQTFSALKTFSAGITMIGTTAGLTVPSMTTAQRDTWGATVARCIYNTTTGQFNFNEGGSWVTVSASGSVADMSTTVAGKGEKATDSEVDAATATGGTGAPIVIGADSASILKRNRLRMTDGTELTIASGAVTATQAVHYIDTEADAASDDLDTITAAFGTGEILILFAMNTARTVVIKHNTGNIKLADGADFSLDDTEKSITLYKQAGNWVELSRGRGAASNLDTFKVVYSSGTNSTTLTNPTAATPYTEFDTHTYTIPANDLVAGIAYFYEIVIDFTRAASTSISAATRTGTTVLNVHSITPGASGTYILRGKIMGTTSAGASAAVKCSMTMQSSVGAAPYSTTYNSVNLATNGSLVLKWAFVFDVSNGGNNATIVDATIWRSSTTAS